MSEYRHKETGEVKSQGAWRAHYSKMSLPKLWKQATLDVLKLEPVYPSDAPSPEKYKNVERNGVTKDENNRWVYAWRQVDMFSTDSDGTKAQKEAAYQAQLDAEAAALTRTERNRLLSQTDYTGLSDHTMTADMAAYRQALRDITSHANFPYLDVDDWPTKP